MPGHLEFVFNSGQWFGTAGVLTRDDFAPWVEWTMPRRLRPPEYFMPGEQGILNYVLNQKAAIDGLRVERRQIMRWPGHSMDGLDAETVSKRAAPPLVVHWAGVKRARQRDMIGADLLAYFEKVYYQRLPAGEARRLFAGYRDVVVALAAWRSREDEAGISQTGCAYGEHLPGVVKQSSREMKHLLKTALATLGYQGARDTVLSAPTPRTRLPPRH